MRMNATLWLMVTLLVQGCATGTDYERLYKELTETRRALRAEAEAYDASTEEMMKVLEELRKDKERTEAMAEQYKGLLASFKDLIDAGTLRVKIVDGRMVVEMPSDVLFPSGSAELSDEGKKSILQVSGILMNVKDKNLQVEGHTDTVPIKTEEFPDNWQLASARAMNVLRMMLEAGVDPKRLSAASYGEVRPVRSNKTTTGRAANRRIEIVLIPDLSDLQDEKLQEALAN